MIYERRHISNIRLVLDAIDFSELIEDDSFILFLDFKKAFNSVKHDILYFSLKNVVLVLHEGMDGMETVSSSNQYLPLDFSYILLPISPHLLLAGQLLSTHLGASPIQGINIANWNILRSQRATISHFLCNSEKIPLATMETFS